MIGFQKNNNQQDISFFKYLNGHHLQTVKTVFLTYEIDEYNCVKIDPSVWSLSGSHIHISFPLYLNKRRLLASFAHSINIILQQILDSQLSLFVLLIVNIMWTVVNWSSRTTPEREWRNSYAKYCPNGFFCVERGTVEALCRVIWENLTFFSVNSVNINSTFV